MRSPDLRVLARQAREAVACTHCFNADRTREWGHVALRPASRPDDVAFAPWVGSRYASEDPRIAVVMLNPGHAAAAHKSSRKDLGKQLRDGAITYADYRRRLTSHVPKWGFGGVVRWLREIGIEPETIAFLNVALCAVADDDYFPELFQTCFERHTRSMLSTLKPDVVLLCGKKQLAPYVELIESIAAKVILTWHYRGMNTTKGRAELRRVRAALKTLARS